MEKAVHSKDFEAYFAKRSTRTPSSLDQIARTLRAEGILPSGARGRHAPSLEPGQLADFLIAAAMAPSPAEAPKVVREFGSLIRTSKWKKKQRDLLKREGLSASEGNLHHYLTSLFRADWEVQKHVREITFRRRPPHTDLAWHLEVQVEAEGELDMLFLSETILGREAGDVVIHRDAQDSLMYESVSLPKTFIRGLFEASRET